MVFGCEQERQNHTKETVAKTMETNPDVSKVIHHKNHSLFLDG